eukprot:5302-Heterococcus_DN1.PRE.3
MMGDTPTACLTWQTREKIFEIIQHQPTLPVKGGHVPHNAASAKGDIQLSNVEFAYPAAPDTPVLQSMSLHIKAGERVAFVGTSGGGKSSLVGLLLRYYDPDAGSISFDGCDLKQLDVKWLRGQMGVVTQDPFLFGVSVRDNIAYTQPDMSMEQVVAAAKLANAHEFILQLSKGVVQLYVYCAIYCATLLRRYDSILGQRGDTLSGGQRQRIAIARAVARQPRVLILDEATSALDSGSEASVQRALAELHAETRMTMIIVAHRLSTVQDADRIVVMQKGVIAEQGTHAQLLELKGVYHKLVMRQLQSEELEGTSGSSSI